MQRILRILLLTCCVLGDATGIQPALELCGLLGQSPLSTNSAALLPSEDTASQVLLLNLCCQISWGVEPPLGMSGMPIVYKSVVDGESELSSSSLWLMCLTPYPTSLPKPSSPFCYPVQ